MMSKNWAHIWGHEYYWVCNWGHGYVVLHKKVHWVHTCRDVLGITFSGILGYVLGVRVAVARVVGAELRLVVDLVPDDGALFAGGDGLPDGEGEPPLPRLPQQLQHLHGTQRSH